LYKQAACLAIALGNGFPEIGGENYGIVNLNEKL